MSSKRRSGSRGAYEQDDEPSGTGEWMWDRFRGGGGGAPLKDVSGGTVTNLRSVIRGSVEVNHQSPSKWKSRNDNSDNESDGSDDSRRRGRGSGKKTSRKASRDGDYDDYDDYSSDRRKNDRSHSNDRGRGMGRSESNHHRSISPDIKALVSPKKGLGSALRDMNIGENIQERELRAR